MLHYAIITFLILTFFSEAASRGQLVGGERDKSRELLPPDPASDRVALPQTAHTVHAQDRSEAPLLSLQTR